jgi:methionine synthase II (cobalamin-independent)
MTTEKNGRFQADGLPVLIGSVPLASHLEAMDWIINATPEIPLWPQLPSNPLERMLPQFVEGLPCVCEENVKDAEGRVYFDISKPGFEEEMLAFYEEYLSVNEDPEKLSASRFQVSTTRAAGLYLFAEKLGTMPDLTAVKGQVTGPFTMLTGIKDSNGRAGYFDDTIRDMVVKAISMKAAWQVQLLAKSCGKPVLMFIDEPALAGLGSSQFISVDSAGLGESLNEVTDAIHHVGGLAGIHVCANTDWSLLLGSNIDILSFDAYEFFNRIAPLKSEVFSFLDRGGILAWGGIPTSRADDIRKESAESLVEMWEQQMDSFVEPGRSKSDLLAGMLITPSCGTGSLPPELARKVLELTKSVAASLRKTYLG